MQMLPDGAVAPTDVPDADEILRVLRLRMEVLRPSVAEVARLEQADAALDSALASLDGKRSRRK
jgi:hypothetical protein